MAAVGLSLVANFPSVDDWEAFLNDVEFRHEIEYFAEVMADIRAHAQVGNVLDLEALERLGDQHYGRALQSIELTAERLKVPPEDLLSILLHA